MASSTEATRLTELHRQAQSRIGAQSTQLAARAWAAVDPHDLDGSFPRWLRIIDGIVRVQGATSAEVAAGYYSAFRNLEVGEPFVVEPVVDVTADTVAANMRVTGPGAVKRAQLSTTTDRAMEIGRSMSSRSAARLVMNCGRDTVMAGVTSDSECIGFARATGGVACSFCAMLASRGAVYKSSDSGGFQAHAGCGCNVEPVYSSNPVLPPGAEQYRDLWDEATAGLGGADARNAFRRALAAR